MFETLGLNELKFVRKRLCHLKVAPKLHLARNREIQPPTVQVFVLTSFSWGNNLGHHFFDDALSLFSMLETFDYSEVDTAMEKTMYQSIPFFVSRHFCNKDMSWAKCAKMWKRVGVNMMGIQPNTVNTAADAQSTPRTMPFFGECLPTIVCVAKRLRSMRKKRNYHLIVRLERVIAEQFNHACFGCMGECTAHRESLMCRFRKWMFQNMCWPKRRRTVARIVFIYNTQTCSTSTAKPLVNNWCYCTCVSGDLRVHVT